MSIEHEHRGRPITAAYNDPQVAAPERASHRTTTSWWRPWIVGPSRNIREWVTAEWRWLALYAASGLVTFAAIAASQSYWPTETMLVWNTVWPPALICSGSVLFVLLVFEWSTRSFEKRSSDTCRTCGERFDGSWLDR